MQFSSLELSQPILRALVEQGYETPTPIQEQAIPPALDGRDVLGCAQTGTGKTAAFALPILNTLMKQPADKTRRGPAIARALILSPTRELACQIGDSFNDYGRHTGLKHTVVYGGVKQIHQERALRKGIDVLVATPGRLQDLMEQGIIDLSAVSVFVLDEADRMLDMGFIEPIRQIASQVKSKRQTLLFSATMPRQIRKLAASLLTDPVSIAVTPEVATAPLIDQSLYMVPRHRKLALLRYILNGQGAQRSLVFTRTKHGAEKVCRQLNKVGVDANSIHGNKTQNQRQRALDGFRRGYTQVLVATDVAARGLDVDGITHVFNYDLPMDPEAYVHRIGRTGRAGMTGIAISFCDPGYRDDQELLYAIEKLIGERMDPISKLPNLPADLVEPKTSYSKSRPDSRQSSARGDGRSSGRPNSRATSSSGSRSDSRKSRPALHDEAGHHHASGGKKAGKKLGGKKKVGSRAWNGEGSGASNRASNGASNGGSKSFGGKKKYKGGGGKPAASAMKAGGFGGGKKPGSGAKRSGGGAGHRGGGSR